MGEDGTTVNADGVSRPGTSVGDASWLSEGRFRALLANVADMVSISDRDGRIIYASPATEKVSGYTPEEFMARKPFDSIHPDDHPKCAEAFEKLANTPGLSLDLEHRVRHKDGGWHWVEGTFTSLFDDPDVGGLLATVRDITERKRADKVLRESEEQQVFLLKLSDALRTHGDPAEIQAAASHVLGEHLAVDRVMYADVDEQRGEIVSADNYVKDGVSKLVGRFSTKDFGQTTEKLRAARIVSVSDSTTDTNLSESERATWSALGIVSFLAVPLVKGERWVSNFGVHHFSPREWSENDIHLVQETAERTWAAIERARAETALRESEERLHLALDSARMGTFLWHVEEDRGEPDAQMLALFGLPDDGTLTLAEALDRLIHPDDRAAYEEAVVQATDPAGDGRLRKDIRVVHPDGSERWLAITAQTVFETGTGRAVQMSGVATDFTERRRAEAERERLRTRAAAMRAEMAERERISRELHDRVAHSMGVVYQSLQLHKALSENAPARAREKLAIAEETARTALDQTRNLAIELRRSVSEETENGVATALRTLIEASAPDGVDAGFSFSGDESTLPRDVGAQVYLVMREAIRNALKHSGCEDLKASLEIHPGELVGSVIDDGDGFDPDTVSDDGRGLGLGSMRERADLVGGQLDLTSQPGQGTTMEIRVPLNDR